MTTTWTYEEDFDGDESLGLHIKKGRQVIASLPGIGQYDFDNAQMLAAAPNLLEALKICESNITLLLWSAHPKVYGMWLDVVRAAIDKAIGEKA
jgi:hypothetical protein